MASPKIRVMTLSAVMEAKRMYAECDSRGRRIWSIMRLATQFAVSETTMYRALNSYSSYQDAPAAAVSSADAAASLRKLLELTSDVPSSASALERMAAEAAVLRTAQERGDALLDELKEEGK